MFFLTNMLHRCRQNQEYTFKVLEHLLRDCQSSVTMEHLIIISTKDHVTRGTERVSSKSQSYLSTFHFLLQNLFLFIPSCVKVHLSALLCSKGLQYLLIFNGFRKKCFEGASGLLEQNILGF